MSSSHEAPSQLTGYGPWPTDDLPVDEIIATEGACLHPRPPTPVYWKNVSPDFHRRLCWILRLVKNVQEYRCRKYGKEAAEEWRVHHTPPELRQKYRDELEAMIDAANASSSPSPSPCDNPTDEKLLPSQKQAVCSQSSRRLPLATPSTSDANIDVPAAADTALDAFPRRKRRLSTEPPIAAVPQGDPPVSTPGELPGPPPRKRRRVASGNSADGGVTTDMNTDDAEAPGADVDRLAKRRFAKSRETKPAAAAPAEGLTRSARIAALARKNYKV
ncbi:uncharacterized protein B0T15DRAFT_283675 [Chaetomium strumarium]|uniref:Uncharacterized protein n=1 Tax=Chaetomium strumarium TaxID=1170767 RepID=A0AAJ0LZX7_9PEZI|nr:hypothetical protein B0T15DRAFT_283675 [Chaetomium strumarium]